MPRRNPQNDTQWKRHRHEPVRDELPDRSDEHGDADDGAADFLDGDHVSKEGVIVGGSTYQAAAAAAGARWNSKS